MTTAPNYCTVDELTDRLCLTGHDRDSAFVNIVSAASRWVDDQTARRFYTVTETRYYTTGYPLAPTFGWAWNFERPSGGMYVNEQVRIDDFMSVSQVATDEDNDGVYEVVWLLNTDYWLAPRNATLDGQPYTSIKRTLPSGRFLFPTWANAIAVTGACGAATSTPPTIRLLTLMVAELMARPLLDLALPGVDNYKIGSEINISMSTEHLPAVGRQILREYQFRAGAMI